jgi:hypothetical protein
MGRVLLVWHTFSENKSRGVEIGHSLEKRLDIFEELKTVLPINRPGLSLAQEVTCPDYESGAPKRARF